MARKQKAKGFNKFLDFIGLVDTDNTRDDDFDAEYDNSRSSRGRAASKNINLDDEFADEPRMTRAQPRRERTASSANSAVGNNNRFDADEGWDTAASRPEYGARNQQRAQGTSRPSSGRYGSEQRYGNTAAQSGRTSTRYENTQSKEDGSYYRSNSYESTGSYQTGSYRTGSSYGAYGASGRRNEEPSYGTPSATPERAQYGGYQRHQTVIFKLHSVDECRGVILALIEKKSVLLNLDELDSLQAQRTLDTMSGATFAIGATLSRASDRTWLITPSTVEVADSQAEAGGSYGGRYM